VSREIYCGAVGWVDADEGCGDLNVAIRTFWLTTDDDGRPTVRFGTGGGITWDSDPAGEWAETELKARRLLEVASGRWAELARG
jgi:para-aminobenzoate synthetase component 1